jgi:PleD family two-component response regulator
MKTLPSSKTGRYLNSHRIDHNLTQELIEMLKVDELAAFYLQYQTHRTRRVLVVEDDFDTRFLNARALLRAGYQVDSAEDGAIAWDMLQEKKYDLLACCLISK